MTTRKKHKCPTCKQDVTKAHYDKIMGMEAQKKKALEDVKKEAKKLKDAAKKQADAQKLKMKKMEQKFKEEQKKQKEQIKKQRETFKKQKEKLIKLEVEKATKKQSVMAEKLERENERQKKQIELLKKAKNEIDAGFANEKDIEALLKKHFSGDIIKIVGKKGDITHDIMYRGKVVARIIIECKLVQTHSSTHETQTRNAIKQRSADYGILVTTGKNTKTFSGFKSQGNLIVTRPQALIHFIKILRDNVIENKLHELKGNEKKDTAVACLNFVKSDKFKKPILEIIRISDENLKILQGEMRAAKKNWQNRYKNYKDTTELGNLVGINVENVLRGEKLESRKKEVHKLELDVPSVK